MLYPDGDQLKLNCCLALPCRRKAGAKRPKALAAMDAGSIEKENLDRCAFRLIEAAAMAYCGS